MENFSQFFDSNLFNTFIIPILIFLARIIDVTLGTFRISMISKGNKSIAPLIGFIEIFVWVMAIGKIMQTLDNYVNMAAYAGGFAAGNYIGIIIEEKIAMGIVRIQIITAKPANQLIVALRQAGYGITNHKATGKNGEVSILYSIVNRADLKQITEMILEYNPNAFYTIEDVKFVNKKLGAMLPAKGKFLRKGK